MVIGQCNHVNICIECSFKYRSDNQNKKCIYCNTICDEVIVIPNPGNDQPGTFRDFQNKRVVEFKYGICYYDKSGSIACERLKKLVCPIPECKSKHEMFLDVEQLKAHLKSKHRRYYCDLCLKFKKQLLSEQRIYRKEELRRHMEQGDLDSEGTVISVHPFCSFCKEHKYDEEKFLEHMRRDHIKCHVCKGKRFKYMFYKNYRSLRVHFNETHFPCPEQSCVDKAFIVFKTEEELVNHYENEHNSSKSSNSRRKNRGMVITKIGEATPIMLRDKEGEDVSGKLLSQMKARMLDESADQLSLNSPVDMLEFFEMLIAIRVFEQDIIKKELREEEDPDEPIDPDDYDFWFFRDELYERLSREMRGEKYSKDDETREYIKDEILERAKIKKLERKKRAKEKREDADLVYKKSSEKGAHARPSEPPNSLERRNRNLKIEDVIFKRWERGHQIDWEMFQEKSGAVVNYKGHEDIDYYTFEFVNDRIRAQELFDAFVRIFTLKHTFRYFYLFLMTIKRPARRKALSDTLYRQLNQLRFRHKNILTGRRKFIEIYSHLTDILKRVILLRFQNNSFREREGMHSHKLFQFFRSVKTLGAREVVRLKFLGMYLSNAYAIHLVQKAFWIEKREIPRWFQKLGNLDLLVTYLYFFMVVRKFTNQPISVSMKTNPNLLKLFFRLNVSDAEQNDFDFDSEPEDYEFFRLQQIRRQKLIAKRQQQNPQAQADPEPEPHAQPLKASAGLGHWDRAETGLQISGQKKPKTTVNIGRNIKKKKNVFQRDNDEPEVDLEDKFEFPTLGGTAQPRNKYQYTNSKMVKKREDTEHFPTLGGDSETYNPAPRPKNNKKNKKKAARRPNPNNPVQQSPVFERNNLGAEDYPTLEGNTQGPSNTHQKQSKKKRKKKKGKGKNWNDATPSIMGKTKVQRKKQMEEDFPTLGGDTESEGVFEIKKSRMRPNRMEFLESTYGTGNNDVNYLDRVGTEQPRNQNSIVVVNKKKSKRRRKK